MQHLWDFVPNGLQACRLGTKGKTLIVRLFSQSIEHQVSLSHCSLWGLLLLQHSDIWQNAQPTNLAYLDVVNFSTV